jgi:hypothetical protein
MGGRIVLIDNRIKFEQINWNQLKPCINHLKLQTTPLKPIEMFQTYAVIDNRIKFEQINWNQLKPCINHLKLQTTPLKPIEMFQIYAVAKLQQLWFLMRNNSNMHTGRHQIQEKVVHGNSVLAFIFTKPQVNETTRGQHLSTYNWKEWKFTHKKNYVLQANCVYSSSHGKYFSYVQHVSKNNLLFP